MKSCITCFLAITVTLLFCQCSQTETKPVVKDIQETKPVANQETNQETKTESEAQVSVPPASQKLKVLFLCTGNSCRSQMAEAWTRHLKSDCIEPYSAGIKKRGLNPNMLQVMAEVNVDTSMLQSKLLSELKGVEFDYVITVCSHADRNCPELSSKVIVKHIGFDDPPELAKSFDIEEDKLNCYRRVRDEIKKMVESLPDILTKEDVK